jgi:hypothetical protein
VAINRRRVKGLRPRGLTTLTVLAALAGSAGLAGTALAGGPHPDPPPKQPPPPPRVVAPPPPPPVYVAPPPPPGAVAHAAVRKHAKKHVARSKQANSVPKPRKPAQPVLAAAAPVGPASTGGTLAPALLIVAFGAVLALLAVGISFMPAAAVPFRLGLQLERSRQTILLSGLAIGIACALVGLLTAVAGR